uniref:Uncharacterized protein n=1 Tax=Tanacetum cinerariifolium TaxID=118510 RepID=A0A699HL47_TANCI|nr:hypothetical protein [Tanacetum cinerariifolium]
MTTIIFVGLRELMDYFGGGDSEYENESDDNNDESSGNDDGGGCEREIKSCKHVEVGKGDVEMTDATRESGSQENSYEQVIEDAYLTLTTSQKTEGLNQSFYVSSDFASKFLILDNVPPVVDEVASMMNVMVRQEESSTQAPIFLSVLVTTIPETFTVPVTTVPLTIQPFTSISQQSTPTPEPTAEPSITLNPAIPDFSSLFGFDHRVSILEKELSQLKQDNIKDKVKSQLPQILPKEVSDFATPVIQSAINESLKNVILAKSSSQPKSTYEAVASLTASYKLNKDLFESYGNTYSLKRDRDNKDKDEDPSVGSDRGLKKRKTSKDTEPTKGPTQSWLMTLASTADKPSKTFDELMNTPIDFSAYIMNGLNITNLTQETLFGLAFKLLKGTRTNFVELEYDFEECYKALSEKLDWDNPEGGISTMTYTTSTTKTKAAQYDLPSIEDIVLNIWSPVKVAYDKHAKCVTRVEKKINITKPETTRPGIRKRDPYTPYTDPKGFNYVDNQRRNRLMRSNELYKFSDGTLTRLRTSLGDITKNILMEYLPRRRWSSLEKKRAHIMIKAIDKQLKERRMMRSLEKFVGGRYYRTDLRLLQRTI